MLVANKLGENMAAVLHTRYHAIVPTAGAEAIKAARAR